MALGGQNPQTNVQATGQAPPAQPRDPLPMHVDDMVRVRRGLVSRLIFGEWKTVRFGDLQFDTVFRPIGKGVEDNFDYEYTNPITGNTGLSLQPLAHQQTAGVNAGTTGGGSVSNSFKNVMLGLAGLAFILAVGAFGLPQLGINLVPGAPRDSGVTIEQVNDTIADGIKPVSDSVASLNENLTEGLAGIGTTLNEAIGSIDSRIDGLEDRVNNLASIRDGANATPNPQNLNQDVDCDEPGEPKLAYSAGRLYRDAEDCSYFLVLSVNESTGTIDRYVWVPDACIEDLGKDAGVVLVDNYPNCAGPEETPTPTYAPPPVDHTLAKCPGVGEVNMLFANGADAFVPEGSAPYEYCLFETKANGYWLDHALPCNTDWAMEMDTKGPEGRYWFCNVNDEGREFWIEHASIRLVPAYAAGDPLYTPCAALENSRAWLRSKGEPAFSWAPKLRPGNFDCPSEPAAGEPTTYEGADPGSPWVDSDTEPGTNPGGEPPQDDNVNKVCPKKAGRVANLVGGKANEWSWHRDEGGYWKRVSSSQASLKNPWGSLDIWSGSTSKGTYHPNVGRSASGYEATWHCNTA